MIRIFDKRRKKWINEDIYLAPNEDIYMMKGSLFGKKKLTLVSSERYVYQNDINLTDKNDILIYEGDIVKANISDNRTISAIVTYAPEVASYILLNYETSEFFTLGTEESQRVEVIGNVMENYDIVKGFLKTMVGDSDDELSLQET